MALTFAYDAANNRTRITWPDGNYFQHDFDALNRMTAIRENGASSGAGVLAAYGWDELSRRESITRGNGTATAYDSYDLASRLESLTHELAGSSHDATLEFGYTAASQLSSRATTNSALGWWSAPEKASTYVANKLNQYASVSGASFTHDLNGNLTSDGSRSFTYDLENRLIAVSGAASLSLGYDPLGRLRETSSGGNTTRFLYEGDRLSGEYSDTGTLLRRYVHGPGIDDPVVWYEGSGLATPRLLHADERGSVIAHSDDSGAASVYSYGPYGEQDPWTGSRFRYTGQIMLPEAKLYHYKARVYDPQLGRFLQTDPVGYGDDLNLYAYVGNDPVNSVDPSGLAKVCSTATGSHIPSCVDVDADGDGQVDDDDLTEEQGRALSSDFATFIHRNHGRNLAGEGAKVYGLDPVKTNFVRSVSQFVGAAQPGSMGGIRIFVGNSSSLTRRAYGESGHRVLKSHRGVAWLEGNQRWAGVNTDAKSLFWHGGNTARTLIHEKLHFYYELSLDSLNHDYLDAHARRVLRASGLADGGCEAIGGFFGFFVSYPSCD